MLLDIFYRFFPKKIELMLYYRYSSNIPVKVSLSLYPKNPSTTLPSLITTKAGVNPLEINKLPKVSVSPLADASEVWQLRFTLICIYPF